MIPIQTIEPNAVLAYHRHAGGYVAVVLGGSYVEAAQNGRFHVSEGWVVFHPPFQPHFNRVAPTGARVLNLVADACPSAPAWAGRLPDPLRVVRLAARNPRAAVREIMATAERRAARITEWPDLLAGELSSGTVDNIGRWARARGLTAETISRGFQRCYGATPVRFRADARARRALTDLVAGDSTLATVAQDVGYSDQAHMTRAITRLTGRSPGAWRRLPDGKATTAVAA